MKRTPMMHGVGARSPRSIRRLFMPLIAACVFVLAAATPAQAGHESRGRSPHRQSGHTSFRFEFHSRDLDIGHRSYGRYDQPCRKSYAEIEYDRGYGLGRSEGWHDGHDDGLVRRPYCGKFIRCLDRESPHFARGYRHGYRAGYDDGYVDGKRAARGRSRPCRSRW